jgi:hypothetical protein
MRRRNGKVELPRVPLASNRMTWQQLPGCPDDDHSCLSKERFQRLGYMPAVFDDEDAQPAQTRRGGAQGFLQHGRIPIRHGRQWEI